METGETKMPYVYKWRQSFLHTSPEVVSTSTGPETTRETVTLIQKHGDTFSRLNVPSSLPGGPCFCLGRFVETKMNLEGVKCSDFFILRVRVSPAGRLPWLLHRLP